jgi:hypothetical protein
VAPLYSETRDLTVVDNLVNDWQLAMAIATSNAFERRHIALGILAFAYDTFSSNKIKFSLTALGMVIGTASLILVTTIGLTGKQYVLDLIQSIGANLIFAEYEGGAPRITLLMFHDHSAGAGASSPEASKYEVSWLAQGTRQAAASPMDLSDMSPVMHHHHESAAAPLADATPAPDAVHDAMGMDHQHVMTPAMLKVEHQHLFFALIGIAVLLLKFMDDARLWGWSFVRYCWPVCITVLGLLLVLYRQ